jgi:beta-N-acetylhexosaminidase
MTARLRPPAALRAAVIGLALVVGACGGGGATATAPATVAPPAPAAEPQPSLREQVGQLLVIAYAGTTPPRYVLRALREGRAAGVILFAGNAPDAATVRKATARLQRAAGGDAIVALDQEGGDVRVLSFAPSAVGQARQPTPAAARAAAAATARALRGVGVNVVLGPVADVATTRGSFMAGRAYPGDAARVTASTRAAVEAYERAGVAATLKHFPGVGGSIANTDDASSAIRLPRTQLAADLRPFREGGAPLVMLGHARYPALDRRRIASQSPAIATGLLRGELGFEGVAITDSLEAQASLDTTGGDVGEAAARSLAAGADLLLMTGPGSFPHVRDALLARARRDPAFRARVAESADRVLALRRELAPPE